MCWACTKAGTDEHRIHAVLTEYWVWANVERPNGPPARRCTVGYRKPDGLHWLPDVSYEECAWSPYRHYRKDG